MYDIEELLRSEYGITREPAMTAAIAEWAEWRNGRRQAFHSYRENSADGHPLRREMFRMNMAKKIAEDWASLLINDRVSVSVGAQAQSAADEILEETGFLRTANRLAEDAFALGTAAAVLRLDARLDEDGNVLSAHPSGYATVTADGIFPVSVNGNGEITECAFVSERTVRGKRIVYAELHLLENGCYTIHNDFWEREDGKFVKVRGELPPVIGTGCPYPLFAVLTPNLRNCIAPESGMGVSIFADATDCLKGVDLAFNNFCRDMKLGGKKVFINRSLTRRDGNGVIYTPDDVAQQLFVTVGDGDIEENPLIVEHNPELRASENAEAVQAQLNYLSFRCGLGVHHYSFGGMSGGEGRARMTATQYMGERQDMRQNAVKHQKNAADFIRSALRPALYFAGHAECKASVRFDDSYFTDTESERERDLKEVQAGIMTTEEFRAKWMGGYTNA